MAFSRANFAKADAGYSGTTQQIFTYISSTDTYATIVASAYFNSMVSGSDADYNLKKNDVIFITGSDESNFARVTSTTGATPVTVASVLTAGDMPLAQGSLLLGNASGLGSAFDLSGAGNIAIGNGTTVVALDGSTDTQILVGNGTTMTSVAVSGDATLANTGALTIAAGAVEESMLVANSLTGLVCGNLAAANVIGIPTLIHLITTAGGATANTDVTLTHKSRVLDVWTVNKGLGTAGDTIQVLNATNAITDAIDINIADTTRAAAGTIDDAYVEIAAGGTLRVTETDGGGSDSPAVDVFVLVARIA
jgi:hypothetical protein